MEQYVIKGKNKLSGTVVIDGAKNAVLPLIAAAILPNEPVTLTNVPEVSDVINMLNALKEIGATISPFIDNTVTIDGSTITTTDVSYENIKKIRASYYLIGALLAKYGKANVPMPGGCDLGNRPIDQHIKGFKRLGAVVNVTHGFIEAHASKDHLIGRSIFMDIVSVGATINVMLAASMAEGLTIITNAAKEPHVVDVANLLVKMGVEISGIGTDRIKIVGNRNLKGVTHEVIPDQIEAATFMLAAAATGSEITLKNVDPADLIPVSAKLMDAGCVIETTENTLTIKAPEKLKAISVATAPHPGYPTDAQPQMTAALCNMAFNDTSVIKENIFVGRFNYIAELVKMGADIKVYDKIAVVTGVEKLQGAIVESSDLRAGAALIIAGLMAEGTTYVRNIHFIKRGYNNIEKKLQGLGANITLETYELEEQKA